MSNVQILLLCWIGLATTFLALVLAGWMRWRWRQIVTGCRYDRTRHVFEVEQGGVWHTVVEAKPCD